MVVLIFERWREKVEVRGCDEAENLIFEAELGKGGMDSICLILTTHFNRNFGILSGWFAVLLLVTFLNDFQLSNFVIYQIFDDKCQLCYLYCNGPFSSRSEDLFIYFNSRVSYFFTNLEPMGRNDEFRGTAITSFIKFRAEHSLHGGSLSINTHLGTPVASTSYSIIYTPHLSLPQLPIIPTS